MRIRIAMSESLPVSIVAILLACAGSASEAPEHSDVLRDSAGVIILEAPVTEPVQLVTSDTPSVRIGVVDGDERYQLYEVRGVRTLPDRSILVLNAGTHEIRRYSPDGVWLASYGRHGSGPGELQFPSGLTRALSDSTLVLDYGGFHIVDPEGRIVRSQAVQTSMSGFVGLLDSTSAVVAAPNVPRGVYDQIVTAEVAVAVVDLAASTTDTLLALSGFQQYKYTHGDLVRTVTVPFTTMPALGVRSGETYVADGRAPEVRVYARSGHLIRIVRLRLRPVRLEQEEWESTANALIESRARTTRGEGRLAPWEVERQREVYRSMTRPEVRPFFDRMYLGDHDTVWLREYQTLGQPQRWLGIDSQGRIATILEVPSRVYVRDITADWVLGQEVDSMEVEYVVRYPTRRTQ